MLCPCYIIYCVVIVYTGDGEGTMSKRGAGIESRQTYVKYYFKLVA